MCGLRHSVLGGLGRTTLDDLTSRLGLEDRRLLREGVDALACLGGWLLHDHHTNQARYHENAVLLQLGIADAGHGLDDTLDVLAGELSVGLVGDCLN